MGQEQNFAGQSYRLATGGEDNHVRVRLMLYPNDRARCFHETELEFKDMDGTSEHHAG